MKWPTKSYKAMHDIPVHMTMPPFASWGTSDTFPFGPSCSFPLGEIRPDVNKQRTTVKQNMKGAVKENYYSPTALW